MNKCIAPCFKNLDTNVVTIEESECMTNCMAKGLETQAMFKYMNADQDLKNFGGYKK